jgi:hypothetical protein
VSSWLGCRLWCPRCTVVTCCCCPVTTPRCSGTSPTPPVVNHSAHVHIPSTLRHLGLHSLSIQGNAQHEAKSEACLTHGNWMKCQVCGAGHPADPPPDLHEGRRTRTQDQGTFDRRTYTIHLSFSPRYSYTLPTHATQTVAQRPVDGHVFSCACCLEKGGGAQRLRHG